MMKSLMLVAVTVFLTGALLGVALLIVAFKLGVLSIEEQTVAHNQTVIEDGVVVSEKNWEEFTGYRVNLNLNANDSVFLSF